MKEGERRMTKMVRLLRSGQITIPAEFRKALGITEESLLQLTLEEGELRLRPVAVRQQVEGSLWLRELYEYFAPVRQEAIDNGYSEEEINAAIDEAVAAVRKQHAHRRH